LSNTPYAMSGHASAHSVSAAFAAVLLVTGAL
jgi:hypothetical protein